MNDLFIQPPGLSQGGSSLRIVTGQLAELLAVPGGLGRQEVTDVTRNHHSATTRPNNVGGGGVVSGETYRHRGEQAGQRLA